MGWMHDITEDTGARKMLCSTVTVGARLLLQNPSPLILDGCLDIRSLTPAQLYELNQVSFVRSGPMALGVILRMRRATWTIPPRPLPKTH